MTASPSDSPSVPEIVDTATPVVPQPDSAPNQSDSTHPGEELSVPGKEPVPSPNPTADASVTEVVDSLQRSEDAPQPASLNVEEGFLFKRGPLPLRLWQKRFFRLPSANQTYPLHKLHIVYKKNAKKQAQSVEEFEKNNKYLLDTLATATVNANSILSYYKSDGKDELPHGLINLKHVEEIFASPKIKPFAFTIKTKSRIYVFSTASQAETDAWIYTLKSLSSVEIPNFSDTAAYKFSYSQLLERKVLAAPQSQDEEVFSASEAEVETDEVNSSPVPATQSTDDPQPQVTGSQPGSKDSAPEPATHGSHSRKSFYNEVIGFFRKGSAEPEGKKKDAATSEPVAQVASDATEQADVAQEVSESNPDAETKPSEFSQEIADMVAPITSDPPALEPDSSVMPTEESTDNRPTRTKTFNIPKFEGKIFSKIFKKNGHEEAHPGKEEVKPEEMEKEIEGDQPVSLEHLTIEPKPEPVTDSKDEPVADSKDEPVTDSTTADKPTGSESPEQKSGGDTVKSVKRPFIQRLLSGSTKGKPAALDASEADKPTVTEAEVPVQPSNEVVPEPTEQKDAQDTPAEPEGEDKTEDPKAAQASAQRHASSFITRIGEMAYSAVSTPEVDETVSEAFEEKAKSAKCAGFLFKQSTLFHTNNLRYVILSEDGALTYFRNAQTPSDGKKIIITDATELISTDELLFTIKLAAGSTLTFQAKKKEDRDSWLSALKEFAKSVLEVPTAPESATPTDGNVSAVQNASESVPATAVAGSEPSSEVAAPISTDAPAVESQQTNPPSSEEVKPAPVV